MEKLIRILKDSPIADYRITCMHSESVELFYVLNKLETNRATSIDEVSVTIYIDEDSKRGEATFAYNSFMSEEELRKEIAKRIYAAKFALNPYFEIPSKSDEIPSKIPSNFENYTLQEAAEIAVKAVLNAKQCEHGVFSANEIFVTKKDTRVLNSRGVDLSSTSYKLFIELIPSYEKDGEEVETYNNLEFSSLDPEEITRQVNEAMELTKARYEAIPLKLEKPVKVIIEGEDAPKYFGFFARNLSYTAKYQHINRFEVGQSVQGDEITGDKLNINLLPFYEGCSNNASFDRDGVILKPLELIKDGVAMANYGLYSHGYLLGVKEPVGLLPIVQVLPGSKSFEEMKKEPYVRCVKFSSFQFEEGSGFFGGEVRLGFYFDGEKEIPVTGFSIAASIHNAKSTTILSKETEITPSYVGPKYLEIKDMTIN